MWLRFLFLKCAQVVAVWTRGRFLLKEGRYVTQFLLGTLILKEQDGSVCAWVAVLTLCLERLK